MAAQPPAGPDNRMPEHPRELSGEQLTEHRRLLAYLAAAHTAGGAAAHEVEVDVVMAARGIGYPRAQVRSDPNGVWISLAPGEPAAYEAVEGGLRLDQSARVAAVQHGLETGSVSPEAALDALASLRAQRPRFPVSGMYLGGFAIAFGVGTLLQPSWNAVLFATAVSPVVVALMRLTSRRLIPAALLPLVASFCVAVPAFLLHRAGWVPSPLRSLLPPVAVLLPGSLIVTGLSELVAGRMTAGASRLVYGSTQLVMFAAGIAAAAFAVGAGPSAWSDQRVDEIGPLVPFLGIALLSLGICLQESVPWRLAALVFAVLTATYAAQWTVGLGLGAPAWGSLLAGGAVASFLSWTAAAVRPGVPRLVLFLPSFWLLVPGSLGLVSVARLGVDPGDSWGTVLAMTSSVLAIAIGLIVGTSAARGLRRAGARVAGSRRRRALQHG